MANEIQVSKRPIDALKSMLDAESVTAQFNKVLGKRANQFIGSIIEVFNGDANLQKCDPKDICTEALKAATLGLPINKSLGLAYIVPFNNTIKNPDGTSYKKQVPTMIPGYKGYIQLALRTGKYECINADVVLEGELGVKDKLTGEISFDGDAVSDKVIGYFCHIKMLGGFRHTIYMSVGQMARYAKRNGKAIPSSTTIEMLEKLAAKPYDEDGSGVGWLNNFHGMAIKTVIRRNLSKYGYLSTELQDAIESDERPSRESSDSPVTIPVEEVPVKTIEVKPEEEAINPGF